MWVCSVLDAESRLRPSLALESKKLAHGKLEGIFPYRGLKVLHSLCLQRTPITVLSAIIMAPLAGKHDSNENELGTQLIHVIFTEKS